MIRGKPFKKGQHSSVETEFKKGHSVSQEIRRKLSKIQKGKHLSEETKKKISELMKGHLVSEKTRKKISLAHKGKKLSLETKQKMSKAAKGKKINKKQLEGLKMGWRSNKGKKMSEEARKKMSEAHKGKKLSIAHRKKISKALKGERSYRWKGGITIENMKIRHSVEVRLWREAVFTRDNFVCQKCGKRGYYLHSHHIQNFADYPELRTSIENGITLCKGCHKEFHKIYGKKNNTKKQLVNYLEEKRRLAGK